MNQELTLKSTNYMDEYTFYNKFQFCDVIKDVLEIHNLGSVV